MHYRVEYIPNVNNVTIKVKKFKTLGELVYAGRRSE